MGRGGRRRLLQAIAVALVTTLLFADARAEGFSVALAPQPLADALDAFAKATGYQLVYRAELAEGLTSKGADAGLPALDTLRQILRGTGLDFDFVNDRTITIFKAVRASTHSTLSPGATLVRPETQTGGAGGGSTTVSQDSSNGGDQKVTHRGIMLRLAAALGLCVAAAGSNPACAQATVNAAGTASADVTASNTEQLSEVVVTGSRVIKDGNDMPTPVTVISTDDMAAVHPATLADQLNDLPQLSGSRSPLSNPSPGGGTNPNPGANVLNLRNFGLTRTLILFDGHRVAPTGPDGTVDVDMIPQLLLQRVDIVTGGASAVYGSDAITGVVNFITDTHFNGVKVNAQAGESIYHDDPTDDFAVAWGSDLFGGRGHVEASYEYRGDQGIPDRFSRSYFATRWTIYPVNGQYILEPFAAQTSKDFGGLITNGPLNGETFDTNGVLTPFVHGTPIGGGNPFESGGEGAYFDSSLKAQLDMQQVFGRIDYDVSDRAHAYVELAGTYNYNHSTNIWNPLQFGNGANSVTLNTTDPFLAAQYQTILSNAGIKTFTYGKVLQDAPPQNVSNWERQYSVDTGLNVKLGGGYEWDSAFIYSGNVLDSEEIGNLNTQRLAASLNAVINPANGQIVCAVTLTNPGLYPGCVPENPFGPTSDSPSAVNYFIQPTWLQAYTTMADVVSSVTGAPFGTWAGPVNTALSVEWRRLAYHLNSTAIPTGAANPISCAGLPLNCLPTDQIWAVAATAARSPVSQSVGEAALEFDAPLLKDALLAKSLSLNGAARWTEYSTSGPAWTWKLGLDWQLDNQLTLRATHSRDIRAPNLNDLYQPATVGSYQLLDYLTNVELNGVSPASDGKIYQAATTYAQGNPKLVPEVGNTTTAGLVLRPNWAPGFSVALDSFFINLTNAITSLNGTSQTVQLGCANSGGASPLCELIVRPINCCSSAPANSATAFYTSGVNIASQWSEGADVEANYAGRWRGEPYNLRLLATYQPHIVYNTPGSGSYDMGGAEIGPSGQTASPVWRASALGRYMLFPNFTVNVMERWRSELAWGPRQNPPLAPLVFTMPPIGSTWYTDLTLSYLIQRDNGSQLELYANAENLFNRQPPIAPAYNQLIPGFSTFASGDDPIGAYFTVGLRYRMK